MLRILFFACLVMDNLSVTPWSCVLLEKLIRPEQVKKLPTFN